MNRDRSMNTLTVNGKYYMLLIIILICFSSCKNHISSTPEVVRIDTVYHSIPKVVVSSQDITSILDTIIAENEKDTLKSETKVFFGYISLKNDEKSISFKLTDDHTLVSQDFFIRGVRGAFIYKDRNFYILGTIPKNYFSILEEKWNVPSLKLMKGNASWIYPTIIYTREYEINNNNLVLKSSDRQYNEIIPIE
jgi:hypothetical protein